jgi:2'-5' RNA ligase
MHVTLKFMAKLPVVDVEALAGSVGALVAARRAPEACPFKLGSLPSASRASLVLADLVDTTGDLRDLAALVEGLAKKAGLPSESRRFRPHVTLARIKLPFDARRWLRQGIAEAAGACRAAGVTLFRSDLGADGATYVPLARFVFASS